MRLPSLPVVPALPALVLVAGCLLLGACANVYDFPGGKEAKSRFGRVAGTVSSPDCGACATIVVAVGDKNPAASPTYRVYERPGRFDMVVPGDARDLFAFNDLNHDFHYEDGEPSGWLRLPGDFGAGGLAERIELKLRSGEPGFAAARALELRGMALDNIEIRLGTVAGLDDARFDPDVARLGLWQPLRFMEAGYAGIYFLEAYDPHRTPVLFVHGVNGTPREFAAAIARLDRKRFQPWVLYYPAGLELDVVGDGMHAMLSALQHRYRFERLHIVAHSVGGLAGRSYLGACARDGGCRYVRSFITISSPFGGHDAALDGIRHSPLVLPVWRSMATGSRFLDALFAEPLPGQVRHHLLFSYHNASGDGSPCGDGRITLASQLRREAQQQAASVRGFDEDHGGILESGDALDYLMALLDSEESLARRPGP